MRYSKKFLQEALHVLQQMEFKRANSDFYGICSNLRYPFKGVQRLRVDELLESLFPLWPKYSGDINYPVPGGMAVYVETSDYPGVFWGRETKYGKDRYALLAFLIASVQDMLDFIEEQEEDEES